MNFDEKKFKEFVKPHILRCRNGDWNHAKRVVSWVRKLGEGRDDLLLLITAGYIHDIGWRDVLPPQKLSLEKLFKYEDQANANSKPFIKKFLTTLKYTNSEIIKVLQLVAAADKHESKTDDEAIIVDADNLSKLDINHLREKYKKSEWPKMYEFCRDVLSARIRTSQGKKLYPSLLEKLLQDIKKYS